MKNLTNKFFCLSIFILLMPVNAFAVKEDAAPVINTGQMSSGYMLQLVLGLVIVIACIVILAWLAKRMNRLQSSTGNLLKIIGGISVGNREKIVLLQVGSEQLLIGVCQGNISKLHLLDTPIEAAASNATDRTRKSFSHSLSEKMAEKTGLSERLSTMRTEKK